MKISSLLLFLGVMHAVASTGFGQTSRINLDLKNATLEEILTVIEANTDYFFLFRSEEIRNSDRYNVNIKDGTVFNVLDEVLPEAGLDYKVFDRYIAISTPQVMSELEFQEVKISGKVTDSSGEPLPGVTVLVSGTNLGTVTDGSGNYVLEGVPEDAILVFSFIGMETEEVPVAGNSVINVTLNEATIRMEEVIFVGYGTQKRANLTGAVDQISAAKIASSPSPDIIISLQGRMPGLMIQPDDGDPRNTPDFNVRGFTSLNGGSPLVLVDGIEGQLERLNPADIESITVLKDASSAAIYGARGAFGVILVTTKSGKDGTTKVDYSFNYGMTTPAARTDFISDPYVYGKTVDNAIYGYNGSSYTMYDEEDWETIKQVAAGEIEPFHEILPTGRAKFFYNTNWYDYLFRKWQPSQNHNLSISGGNEKVKAYMSGRYYKIATIENIAQGSLERYNLNAKVSYKVNKWLKITDRIDLSTSDKLYYSGYKGDWYDLYQSSLTMYHLMAFEPNFIDGVPYDRYGSGAAAAMEQKAYWRNYYNEQLVNTLAAVITPLKGLSINLDFSNRIYHSANTTRLNQFDYITTSNLVPKTVGFNRLTESRNRNYYNAMNAYSTYVKNIGENHHFKVLMGYNQEEYNSDNILAEQGGILVPNLENLNLGTEILRADGSGSVWSVKGYFGRFNYDYKNRYLLEVNARYDGSSRFPEESRWGFFPSVSVGWYISQENFWAPLKDKINSFKLRASYGKLGNQNVDLYTFTQTMNSYQSNWLIDGNQINYTTSPEPLPDIVTWEETGTIDFGVDMGFLDNRLQTSFDWYERNTKGMYISGEPLPAVFGASEPKENIAGLRNRGFELTIAYNTRFDVMDSPMVISAGLSTSNYVSTITEFPNPEGVMSSFWEGQRLGDIWGYHVDGQFQSDEEAQEYEDSFLNPSVSLGKVYNYVFNIVQNEEWKGLKAGDVKYMDTSGDGQINKGNYTLDDHGDISVIGNAMPKFPFGLNFSAQWKNIDLAIAAIGVARQDWYPYGDLYWGYYRRPYLSFIRKDLLEEAWSVDNPNGIYPQVYRGYASMANRELGEFNDYYLVNIGYLRIKNLTLGYTIPEQLTRRVHIERLRIYFSAENIFTWSFGNLTKYIDPEQAGAGISFSDPAGAANVHTGNEWTDYPMGRTFSFGINLSL